MPNDVTDYLLSADPAKEDDLARAKAALAYFEMRIGPDEVEQDPTLLDKHRELVAAVERARALVGERR